MESTATTVAVEKQSTTSDDSSRESWSSRLSFLLACIGYAVGLGNIWRFPYNVYKSGGGAFLVPYVVMLALCGIPLLFMEMTVGQYTRRGPIGALGRVCPILKGAGVGTVIISFLLSTYYNVILAWTLFYLGVSMQDPLPWTGCNHTWNTDHCFDVALPPPNNNISSLKTHTNHTYASVASTQEYFDRHVLQMSTGLEQPGQLRWQLLGLLAVAWVIVYLCLWRGVTLTGKIVFFTATLPCVLLVTFAVRGLTLPGAARGVYFFLRPDWSRVLEPAIWVNAASQVFNSIGIAFGSLIAFSSYNKFEGPILQNTVIVTCVDAVVSLVCGIAVFSVLGSLAHAQGLGDNVDAVVTDGPGLVFVVFPHVLAHMPWPQLWSVLFFLMLLCLGIDSQFATVEVIITSVKDGVVGLEKKLSHEALVAVVCVASFLCGIPHVLQSGIYSFAIVDFYSATISLMFIALLETVAIVWCYGTTRLAANIEDMTGHRPSTFFTVSWRLVTPALIFVIWLVTLFDYSAPTFGGDASGGGQYEFPSWAIGIGWTLTAVSLVSVPAVGLYEVARAKGNSAINKLTNTCKSKIERCPCCGGALDENLQAHVGPNPGLYSVEQIPEKDCLEVKV